MSVCNSQVDIERTSWEATSHGSHAIIIWVSQESPNPIPVSSPCGGNCVSHLTYQHQSTNQWASASLSTPDYVTNTQLIAKGSPKYWYIPIHTQTEVHWFLSPHILFPPLSGKYRLDGSYTTKKKYSVIQYSTKVFTIFGGYQGTATCGSRGSPESPLVLIHNVLTSAKDVPAPKNAWRCTREWPNLGQVATLIGKQMETMGKNMNNIQLRLNFKQRQAKSAITLSITLLEVTNQRPSWPWHPKTRWSSTLFWLVVEPPLWKTMEFVSWDDDIPYYSPIYGK